MTNLGINYAYVAGRNADWISSLQSPKATVLCTRIEVHVQCKLWELKVTIKKA